MGRAHDSCPLGHFGPKAGTSRGASCPSSRAAACPPLGWALIQTCHADDPHVYFRAFQGHPLGPHVQSMAAAGTSRATACRYQGTLHVGWLVKARISSSHQLQVRLAGRVAKACGAVWADVYALDDHRATARGIVCRKDVMTRCRRRRGALRVLRDEGRRQRRERH